MPGVWRFPLLPFAELVTTAGLLLVLPLLLHLRRRSAAVVALLASPAAVEPIVEPAHRAAAARGLYINWSPWHAAIPALVTIAILIAAALLFRTPRSRGTFIAASLAYFALNIVNWCNPGWCGRYGFPFAYQTWSDARLLDDSSPLAWPMLPLDIALFLTVSGFASFRSRRTSSGTK